MVGAEYLALSASVRIMHRRSLASVDLCGCAAGSLAMGRGPGVGVREGIWAQGGQGNRGVEKTTLQGTL